MSNPWEEYAGAPSAAPWEEYGSSVILDDETGAPLKDRFIIGSATSPEEKLSRARALYGDRARQDADGRISYVNPETGMPTYVNPSGFDMGDIAGGGREIASVGASLPFKMSLWGIPASAAAGAATGQGVDAIAAAMARGEAEQRGNQVPEMQAPLAAAQDFGMETAMGTISGGLMKGVGAGLGKVINPTDARLVQAWRDLGLQPPSLGSVSGGKSVARVEAALGDTITGSGFIERGAVAGRRGLESSLADIAERLGGRGVPTTPDELGVMAQRLAAQNRKAWQAASSQQSDAMFQSFGNTPASLKNTQAWIDDTASKLSPRAGAAFKRRAENIIRDELADSGASDLNIHTIRALRTRLGQLADDPNTITTGNIDKGVYKKLSTAAKEDIRSVLTPAQRQQFDDFNSAYSAQKGSRDVLEDALFGSGDSTKIGTSLLSPNLSANTVRAMQEVLGPDEFNAIRAGIIRQLGTPRAGAHMAAGEASPATFSTLTGRGRGAYQPEVQQALLGADIDPVRVIAEGMDNAGKTVNTSRTASINEVLRLMRSPAQWTQGLTAMLDPVTSLAVPAGLGFAHTSPAVINALSSPAAQAMSRGVRAASPRLGVAGGLMAPGNNKE
ncbi:MAG: hypothetical protein RBR38_10310 [Desulfomicrobium apsheronum]|nr:hypothetical protein [Desulfomicrobium apsheronum]